MSMNSFMEFAKFVVGASPAAVKTVENVYNLICKVMKDRMSEKTKECIETLVQQAETSGVTEVTASDIPVDVLAELRAAVERAMINMAEHTKLVYISGVQLICDYPLDEQNQKIIWNALTDRIEELNLDPDVDKEYYKIIDSLKGNICYPMDDDHVSVHSDNIYLYFEYRTLYHNRYENEIRKFVDDLNKLLDDYNVYISSFIIF